MAQPYDRPYEEWDPLDKVFQPKPPPVHCGEPMIESYASACWICSVCGRRER